MVKHVNPGNFSISSMGLGFLMISEQGMGISTLSRTLFNSFLLKLVPSIKVLFLIEKCSSNENNKQVKDLMKKMKKARHSFKFTWERSNEWLELK